MNLEINFTNRETYIEWRATWRAIYKEQSSDIRDTKRQIVKAYAENDYDRASRLQSKLAGERKLAHRLMETLAEAKTIAKASREAAGEQKAAA